ncbi:cysteine desulfurase family protein [Brachybacterium sp. J144]|uniref:cysteine desulfurase family protein n=1 Tax=Brachybacterium sp. J144 TaxID=3116487 RepID=UPI002E776E91|nr:cysteine desulfurase family protein [Brachybacterium sp. J144]MEE1650028.1 cysteine desulfurase family protein [Brachybacterium sp. J144]
MSTVYLDAAAAGPVRPEALEAAWPYLTGVFANPSSHHAAGEASAAGLEDARTRAARVLGVRRHEIVFTAGGTEAANLAIKGLALGSPRGRHLVTSPLEHEAVRESVDHLRRLHGFAVTEVEVAPDGTITPSALRAALRPDTTLVSLALANTEIGTITDVRALAAIAHEVGALVHTDAVQAAGWLDLRGLGVDALTLAGHKVGAPKGSGLAMLRGRLPVEPLVHGGGQENGRRSGTENVAFAVALAVALELAEAERVDRVARITPLRDALLEGVLAAGAVLTGPRAPRHPGHLSFCVPGRSGESVLLDLERHGVIASSGSACAAGSDEPSPVLLALGLPRELAQSAVRLTLGGDVTAEQIEQAGEAVSAVLCATMAR